MVSIGVCCGALALIAAVMAGFQRATLRTLQGINPDVTVESLEGKNLAIGSLRRLLLETYGIHNASTMGVRRFMSLIQHPHNARDISHVVTVYMCDPLSHFMQHMPKATQSTELFVDDRAIVISDALARELGVVLGDEVVLRLPTGQQMGSSSLHFSTVQVRVMGTFSTGLEEVDLQVVGASSLLAQSLFPQYVGSQELYIRVKDQARVPSLVKNLALETGLPVHSWHESQESIQAALQLEHVGMLCILLIVLISTGLAMSALVSVQLLYREPAFALLRAYGASYRFLFWSCMLIMSVMSAYAATVGLVGAVCVGYVIDAYRLIPLPTVYYVDHLPVAMSWQIILCCFVGTMIVTACAAAWPLRALRRISLHKILAGH